LKKALYYFVVKLIAVILSLLRTNLDHPNPSYNAWRMAYAQKWFLGYFGQNCTKIQEIFFGDSFYIEL